MYFESLSLKSRGGKDSFPLSFFPLIFFIAFLAVSLHGEFKNTMHIFSKKSNAVRLLEACSSSCKQRKM
jgi:low temperature requirement protein LtrA